MIKRNPVAMFFTVLILAVLVTPMFWLNSTTPVADAQGNIPCYRMQGGAKEVAANRCVYEFQAGANLTQLGGTAVPVVHLTPLPLNSYYQPITAAATASISFTVPSTQGIYIIVNTGSNGITIDDAGNTVLAGDYTMGQYDVLTVKSDATRVYEVSRSNN